MARSGCGFGNRFEFFGRIIFGHYRGRSGKVGRNFRRPTRRHGDWLSLLRCETVGKYETRFKVHGQDANGIWVCCRDIEPPNATSKRVAVDIATGLRIRRTATASDPRPASVSGVQRVRHLLHQHSC
jgi:hypothetical protein